MSAGGLSAARLGRMHDVLAGYVERGELPGLVAVVGRHGETNVDAIGRMSFDGDPMRSDTLFRLASLTKPITAVAAMILVEECVLRLDEPVDRLLPELADRRVLRSLDGPIDDTVPAERPITVRDLLTFRMGFGLLAAPPGSYPIQEAAAEVILGLGGLERTADEWLRRLGELPLMHQPGEKWLYATPADVLGVLIARASGRSLEDFMRERIFDPLGMRDTGFSVPDHAIGRLSTAYAGSTENGALRAFDEPANSVFRRPPVFAAGGGGLVSTADDYLAFGQMMLNNGRHGGERILSRPSVRAMTTDQLTPAQKAVSSLVPGYFDTHGWGLGLAVVTGRDGVAAVPGRFGWDGGSGTSWAADPEEDMVIILLTQRAWTSAAAPEILLDFRTLAYQAIDD
ncbi:beta-lactamase family protein [Solihabitans fulvus]|uniref:Beta-lactamase family protein n=1 Tax=Solihabitans fulvus TaxID=1892852 RepID=A0A5B2WXY1_9PSEU|nr:serine hydrolase domain-containing protein [Solihabitans fulvus]KAA2255938.1 beta-lactamase family protein [Solihabitans fulvus]